MLDADLLVLRTSHIHDDLGGQVDSDLKTIYSVVLPICSICKSQGAKTFVGRYKPNGKAIEGRLDQKKRAKAVAEAAAGRAARNDA